MFTDLTNPIFVSGLKANYCSLAEQEKMQHLYQLVFLLEEENFDFQAHQIHEQNQQHEA